GILDGRVFYITYSSIIQKLSIGARPKYPELEAELIEWFRGSNLSIKLTKTIAIASTGYENSNFTIVLACLVDGTKLPPVIIFKLVNVSREKLLDKIESQEEPENQDDNNNKGEGTNESESEDANESEDKDENTNEYKDEDTNEHKSEDTNESEGEDANENRIVYDHYYEEGEELTVIQDWN
ncbi:3544_t:CDS:2, partial [Dentiscutata erythropus]